MRHCLRLAAVFAALSLLWPATSAVAVPILQGSDPGEGCVMVGEKVASPVRVALGEPVQIRLTLQAECPPKSYRPADVIVGIDSSLSMTSDGKLTAAKQAATAFVNRTDLSVHRIGVLSFYGGVTEHSGLSQDAQALRDAIQDIGTRQGTNIAGAVDAAQARLASDGRADAHKVMILITDGSPNLPSPDPKTAATRSANSSKLTGTEIFTIGLGRDADQTLLRQMATDADHYYYSPSGAELTEVYDTIAVLVTDSVVRDVGLADDLAADVKLVDGSALPTAGVSGDVLEWSTDSLPQDGLTWVYQVLPQKVGTYATNDLAVATYRDADGTIRDFTFPVPVITVVSPTLDRLCDQPNGWTIMVHTFPDSVGISGSAYPGCNNRFDSGDWSDGIQHRVPELEYELTSLDDNRVLYRGTGIRGAGMVDQRLYIRVCDPPPYRLRLITKDLNGYTLCPNSPAERLITDRNFRPRSFQRTEVRMGLIRAPQ